MGTSEIVKAGGEKRKRDSTAVHDWIFSCENLKNEDRETTRSLPPGFPRACELAGNNRKVIPADADAMADVRVLRVSDYDGIESKIRERIKNKLVNETTVEIIFERRRPPLEATAAVASLKTTAPVVERFGLQGFGAHSNDAEYVVIDSIEPRLYLATRLIVDIAQGKGR